MKNLSGEKFSSACHIIVKLIEMMIWILLTIYLKDGNQDEEKQCSCNHPEYCSRDMLLHLKALS